jgi:hypothetical protein
MIFQHYPTCSTATQSTDGKFYCTRQSGHDGPCAARPVSTQITPEQKLKDFLPAFRDLFSKDTPDLARFLRLTIQVFDPNAPILGYRGCSAVRDPRMVTLTSDGTSVIGRCRAVSNHGDVVTDAVKDEAR